MYFHSWCRFSWLNDELLDNWKLFVSVVVHWKSIIEMYIASPLWTWCVELCHNCWYRRLFSNTYWIFLNKKMSVFFITVYLNSPVAADSWHILLYWGLATHTVGCRYNIPYYNVSQYNTIQHTWLQWLRQDINQGLNTQQTHHTSL